MMTNRLSCNSDSLVFSRLRWTRKTLVGLRAIASLEYS